MKKYRKKPIVIEAEQWFEVTYEEDEWGYVFDPDAPASIYHLSVGYYRRPDISGKSICIHCGDIMHNHGWIDTLEGGHNVCPGDWIIKRIKGELYPCKNDIFLETYEKEHI